MADRLQELLQQRALIKEHLAWLEGEISAASGRPVEMREPAPTPLPAMPAVRPMVTRSLSLPVSNPVPISSAMPVGIPVGMRDEADTMIARLAAEENPAPVPTKKGCWIFFCATLVVLGTVAWMALRYFYRG